jgi:hypothetical protein
VPRFDTEVDVLCVGSRPPVLAAAISAAKAGMVVLVADWSPRRRTVDRAAPPPSWATALQSAWSRERLSDATMAYLHALTDDVGQPECRQQCSVVPRRHVDDPTALPRASSGSVAPFFGADVLRWTRSCLNSPYGLLYSRIRIPGTREVVQESGERLEINTLGPPPSHPLEASLSAWMLAEARDHGVGVCAVGPLRRLVFDDFAVVGAVFEEAPGTFAVRARHGVALSTGDRGREATALSEAWQSTNSELGIVSTVASHFGRLELLTNPASKARSDGYRSSRKTIPS